MNTYQITLLQSLLKGVKYLDMGKSPVSAIQACFEMADKGLVWMDADGWVHITQEGRIVAVNEREAK